ncbi:hypothetical protein TRVL_08090 [Trypanosoma vivax]|nr:hypothetical protein TRVL_08090 [Trypanosoma vivax]
MAARRRQRLQAERGLSRPAAPDSLWKVHPAGRFRQAVKQQKARTGVVLLESDVPLAFLRGGSAAELVDRRPGGAPCALRGGGKRKLQRCDEEIAAMVGAVL